MTDICVASHHASIAELLADAEFRGLSRRPGFLIELRLDFYSDLSPASLHTALAVFAPNVVATYRHPDEGGRRPGVSDAERIAQLNQAAEHGALYIDIEARTPRAGFVKGSAKLILSFHDFEAVPERAELLRRCAEMAAQPDVDVVKFACRPETVHDGVPLLELLLKPPAKPMVVLGMGEAGFWTRVTGPLFNAPFAFARGEHAPGTAPGQPTWRELEEIYRFREIKPGWPVYGVIGNPIAHSLSPLMHNTALRELQLDGVYLPFKVAGDPVEFIKNFTPLGLKALAVTIPHKEAVLAVCAEIHELARSIGAANTLIRRADGSWWGTNTDAFAAADALEQLAGSLYGKNVLIMGAGGAAKAIAWGVKVRGANVYIANRTVEHAASLATAVGGQMVRYEELDGKPFFAAAINATSVGMYPDVHRSPLDKEQIPEAGIVFDTVYNPLRTKLLELAQERGCRTLEGVAMFIRQGVLQFELYTGHKAPREIMERAVLAALEHNTIARQDLASSGMFKKVPPPQ